MNELREPDFSSDDRTDCFFCGVAPAAWRRPLDDDRLIDRHGDGFTLGRPLFLCDACEPAFAAGRDAELRTAAERVDQEVGDVLPALFRAAQEPVRLERFVEKPEVAALLESGFVDLDGRTGAVDELTPLWPDGQHRAVLDERPNRWQDGARHLVRSPWPALSVDNVLEVLWRWVERDGGGLVGSVRRTRILEVLAWTQDEAAALLNGPDPREHRPG